MDTVYNTNNIDLKKLTKKQHENFCKYIDNGGKGVLVLDYPRTDKEAEFWDYKFWNTKPVQKINDIPGETVIINKKLELLQQQNMFNPYSWIEYDINNDNIMELVTEFLNKNNFSNGNKYRNNYSVEYLRWALGKNGRIVCIHSQNKIGGIMTFNTKTYQIFNKEYIANEVIHFCIHKKLRNKGIAELFINEVERLSLLNGINIGTFGTNRYVPTPICKLEYYFRPINTAKLRNMNYISAGNLNYDKVFDIDYKLMYKTEKMGQKHLNGVYELLCEYQDKYNHHQKYTFDEFVHSFSNNSIVSSYVVLNNDNQIADFYSFYKLDTCIENNNDSIKTAYLHMYTSVNVTQLTIFKSLLTSAKEENIDVLCCNDSLENMDVLFDNYSKFTKGSKYVYLNLFNVQCQSLKPTQICRSILQ